MGDGGREEGCIGLKKKSTPFKGRAACSSTSVHPESVRLFRVYQELSHIHCDL